ncbi:hypothetical protein CI610_01166 [invertebrate metagenome]|uniref:Phospholipid/glycerol acyltransferase domain-containing protein n=1 Tax=invertebrate metagenome TaxID=1711999 RepID=A0A2H9T9H0_9ZZZZ
MNKTVFQLPKITKTGIPEAVVGQIVGLPKLKKLYLNKKLSDVSRTQDFLQSVLHLFDIKHRVLSGSLKSIPEKGPSVVVANHPFGAIEGVGLADCLLQRRSDVKVLANELLCQIPQLKELFIGVDLFGKNRREKNKKSIETARQWVDEGHLLLIFPAGEVSCYQWSRRRAIDPVWRNTAANIARHSKASITPVFIEGQNSWFFHALGMVHPKLRTLRLIHELLNKRGQTLEFRFGTTIFEQEYKRLSSDKVLTNYLRLNTYLLSRDACSDVRPENTSDNTGSFDVLVAPSSIEKMRQDIASLSRHHQLLQQGDLIVYCAQSHEVPNVLQEIGRLREMTFRQVGEGTGLAIDLDSYDDYYSHLFLWNQKTKEVVGAYRIGQVDKIIQQYGIEGLYTHTLFSYSAQFLSNLGCCLELGRSFVCPNYQKSLSALLLLWKGIGHYAARNPHYRTLFGPVSISSDYSNKTRNLMADYLEANHGSNVLKPLVSPRNPLENCPKETFWQLNELASMGDIQLLSHLVSRMEPDNRGIPVLLRQYLRVKGKMVAFNVDADFQNALDGLVVVDLMDIDARTREKYMGREGSQAFCANHTGMKDRHLTSNQEHCL